MKELFSLREVRTWLLDRGLEHLERRDPANMTVSDKPPRGDRRRRDRAAAGVEG